MLNLRGPKYHPKQRKRKHFHFKLTKGVKDGYKLLDDTAKLSFDKMCTFTILESFHPLAYKFELPRWIRIHPIISIDHWELMKEDPVGRKIPEPGPIGATKRR